MRMMMPPPPPPPLPSNKPNNVSRGAHLSRVNTEYVDRQFITALQRPPDKRSIQDLQHIYVGLRSLEALVPLREAALRSLCRLVRYERHEGNDVLYYTGEVATCWFVLLAGSVYIDGSMYLPRHCFGKRSGVSVRRPNECFVLEPSEMLVIDYPEAAAGSARSGGAVLGGTRGSGSMYSSSSEGEAGGPAAPRGTSAAAHRLCGGAGGGGGGGGGEAEETSPGAGLLAGRPELYLKSNRSSHSSDTSSAYSGSDTMHSVQSSLEADEVDLSGLVESVVDSDEEEDLAESVDSLTVRDTVRECLEKDPSERTEDDIETLLEFTQHLRAFTNMTLAVRRELCSVMVFAVVERAGTVVMNDREELDSWSVLINGHVEVELGPDSVQQLKVGDSFGITPTLEKLFHQGVMRTRSDDCQFVCITQDEYCRIQLQGKENMRRHEENGEVVLVTEQRSIDNNARLGQVVIRGTPDRLLQQLVEENSIIDPSYVEDFLLTHRTFFDSSFTVATRLLKWFDEAVVRDRVTRVVLLWVNNHFTDFETDPDMMAFLETFESGLEREKMQGQLRLLNIACAAKARTRNVTLARIQRDDPLQFSIIGGYERGFGILISNVEKHSKAEDVGLKRGDQILEVNGQSLEHVSHARALELLRSTTHLSITVKSNLFALKEMLQTPENTTRSRTVKAQCNIAQLQSDPRARLSTTELMGGNVELGAPHASPARDKKENTHKGSMTLNPKKRLQKALMKILPKNANSDGLGPEDSGAGSQGSSSSGGGSSGLGGNLYQSHSNPDLSNMTYMDLRPDYPEHVLKVYRRTDQTFKYLLIHKETTAHEVVMLALQEFGMTEPSSSSFSLYEVSVGESGAGGAVGQAIVKQRRLPDQLQNLSERIGLSSRYYLKTIGCTETLVTDELAADLVRESQVHFLQLNATEVAIQLTLQDYDIFRRIESTEFVDDLFDIKSVYGTPMLAKFAELVNHEMFWVVTEICSEPQVVRRMKIIKQFIKVARHCKECKNINSMFAILSGLGHQAVKRLRNTWEKVPTKYQRVFVDMEDMMDPSRNMSKYRQYINLEQAKPPVIPFYPVVKKDLTFIHDGNHTLVDGLVNFEKLRMIAKEVRTLGSMCSSPYDFLTMLRLGGQQPSNAMVTLNQMNAGPQQSATVKRKKKAPAAPNARKMFEEAQMVRRVKAYLNNMKVVTDEERLLQMSFECESAGPAPSSAQVRKRQPSPTLSTTSSTSSTSEGKKGLGAPKFGTASPQAVRKILSLSEPKTRPHQPRMPAQLLPLHVLPGITNMPGMPPSAAHHPLQPSPSPSSQRRGREPTWPHSAGGAGSHERSHFDTPATLPPPVDLNVESSSVTSLSNLPVRKHHAASGRGESSSTLQLRHASSLDADSGLSISLSSSLADASSALFLSHPHGSPHPPHRRYSTVHVGTVGQLPMGPPASRSELLPRPRRPPEYNVAAQVSRLHRLGRAHSHEGVTDYYHSPPDEEDDDGGQVSAV